MGLFELFKKKKKIQQTAEQNAICISSEDATSVELDNSCLTIKDNHLIIYTPKERTFHYEVFIPDNIIAIEQSAFELLTNVLEIHIL